MANPYDKFDAAIEEPKNPYDQFDAHPVAIDGSNLERLSASQRLRESTLGTGKVLELQHAPSFRDVGRGILDTVEDIGAAQLKPVGPAQPSPTRGLSEQELRSLPVAGKTGIVATEAAQGVGDILRTPFTYETLGLGPVVEGIFGVAKAPVINRLLALAFAGQMAGSAADKAGQLVTELKKKPEDRDTAKILQLGSGLAVDAAGAGFAGIHAGTSTGGKAGILARELNRAPLDPTPFSITSLTMPAPIAQPPANVSTEPVIPPDVNLQINRKGGSQAPSLPKPVVPETVPEPEKNLTVLEEIRQRKLTTKGQIQSAFPQLSREQAAALRNAAWGVPSTPNVEAVAEDAAEVVRPPATTAEVLGNRPSKGEPNAITEIVQPGSIPPQRPGNDEGGAPAGRGAGGGVPGATPSEAPVEPATKEEASQKLTPSDLTPALKLTSGKIVSGEKGEKHDAIVVEQAKAGNTEVVDNPERGFVDNNGKFLSRRQAADALGETDDLHSERLTELQRPKEVRPPDQIEQKMQAAVDSAPTAPTAKTPSQKEAKSELVSRLEKALADAPSEDQYLAKETVQKQTGTSSNQKPIMSDVPLHEVKNDVNRNNVAIYSKQIAAALEKHAPQIEINIPGDGNFKIFNTKEALTTVLGRARKLDTSSTKSPMIKRSGVSKEDKAAIEQTLTNPEPAAPASPSPEIIGMGGATPSEFEKSPQTPTGIKNSTVDIERARRGLPPAVQPLRKAFGEVWDRAMARVDEDPYYQDNLINELRDHPRALTDEEDAVLLQRQIDLQNEYGRATRALAQNYKDKFAVGVEQERVRVAELRDQLYDLYNINKRVGTETGRGLNARKMMAYEDYSLAAMELGKRAAKGGEPLTEAEQAQVQKLHDEIASWQKKYDDHVAAANEKQASMEFQLAAEKLKKDAAPIPPQIQRIIDRVGNTLHTQADAARARIKARAGSLSVGVDPTVLVDLAAIGAEHIWNGLSEPGEWAAKMISELGDSIKAHIDEIWTSANKKYDETVDRTALDKAQIATANYRKMTVDQRIDYTTKKVTEKLAKGKNDEVTSQAQRLSRALVEKNPTITRDGLVDAVHGILEKVKPGQYTRSQARDMISGYGDFRQLTKDQISIRLRDLKGQLQQVGKLEDMQQGKPPVKTGLERRTPSIEESRLIQEVNKAKRQFQIPITDPNTQLKSSLDTLKARLTTRIRDYEEKLDNQDFAPKERREIKLDSTALRLKAEAERAKQKYQSALRSDQLKSRTAYQKALDTTVKWSRGFLLSGPSTLAKLTAAAFWRIVQNPVEEAIGSGLKRVPYVKDVAERAPIGGRGFSVKHEAKALTEGFTQGMIDAWKTLTTGKSDLDRVFGSRQDSGIGELDDEQKSVVDFFGHLHGALKAPVKRAAFARAFEQQTEFYMNKGVDVTDPIVQTQMAVQAYKQANRDIFMQQNRYADRVRRFITSLEEKDKISGEVPPTANAAATAARVIVPIVRVPTNIVGEAIQYATGLVTGSFKTAKAFRAGIDTLNPEQADLIMRELKKGSVGTGLMLLGYFSPSLVGGFYQQGEKRKLGELKPGEVKMFGHEIPRTALHTPAIETLQLGATVRRVADSKLRKRDKTTQGIGEGILAGALGLADDVPFIQNTLELGKLFNPYEKGQYLGELAKSRIVPQMLSQTAEYLDRDAAGKPIQRKPTASGLSAVPQYLEMGIPGLRKNVPVKHQVKTR